MRKVIDQHFLFCPNGSDFRGVSGGLIKAGWQPLGPAVYDEGEIYQTWVKYEECLQFLGNSIEDQKSKDVPGVELVHEN